MQTLHYNDRTTVTQHLLDTQSTRKPTNLQLGEIATYDSTAADKTLIHQTERRGSYRSLYYLRIPRETKAGGTSNGPLGKQARSQPMHTVVATKPVA